MASSDLNVTACIENENFNDGIICATFNYEEKISVSHTDVELTDLVNSDSNNQNLSQVGDDGSPSSVSIENIDNEICGLSAGFNKTFDARKKKVDVNEARGIILDKTINLLSMKPGNLSLQFDSEESLGIISDVLDDNSTLDLLVPFKSKERSSVQLIKKSGDANLLAFSPLHLRNSNGGFFADNSSPILRRYTSTPEPPRSKPEFKNSEIKQELPTDEICELDSIEPEKCYEDFTKGNIIASTCKVQHLLQDCLNKFEAAHVLPNDLLFENDKVHAEKNNTIEINSANQSSLCLNATFDIKSEKLKEVLPVSELQTDIVSASFEDIPNNNTFIFDNMNNTTEVKTTIDLHEKKELNPPNLKEVLSSCLPISEMDKNKQNGYDSCIKSTKSKTEAKKSMFKRSIAMPIQKLSPKKENNLNTKLNSTFCMENNELNSNNNPTKLDKRCSLGSSSLRIPGSSKIDLVKLRSQPKLNQMYDSKYNGCKLSEVRTSTKSAITVGKTVVSSIQQKNSINTALSRTTVKPKVGEQIKKQDSEEKASLNNTFTKDIVNFVLSPIVEKENQCTESEEEDVPHVEKNCTLSPFKIDIENNKIPKYNQIGSTNNCAPIENEKRSISNKCLRKPTVQTKGNHKGDSTLIPFPRKPQQFPSEKLVSSQKNNEDVILGSQNINLNGKCNLSQTIKNQQFSKLPTFGSTFSKKLIPPRSKVNGKIPIDSKVVPNQCSSVSKSKPSVQPARCLRAPEIFISKEKKS